MQLIQTALSIQLSPGDALQVLGLALAEFQPAQFFNRGSGNGFRTGKGVMDLAVESLPWAVGFNQPGADDTRHGGGKLLPQNGLYQGFKYRYGAGQVHSVKGLYQFGHHRVTCGRVTGVWVAAGRLIEWRQILVHSQQAAGLFLCHIHQHRGKFFPLNFQGQKGR